MPSQFTDLARTLDAAVLRHRVLSHNLANVNTPGFQRLDIVFDDLLTGKEHGPLHADSNVVVDPFAVARTDGNSVDIDIELNQIQKNALAANTAIQVLASKLGMMRTAITGR